jgi:hypothetical protein
MTYGPDVYLSICYTIANVALNFALGQAITIAWWVKALSPDATVKDLHHIWSYGTSLADILLAGRAFNFVALAGLLVTLAPINGPLLQRASVLREHTKVEYKNLSIPVAQYMLPGYTGWLTSRASAATVVGDDFGAIINEYTSRKDMNISDSGCFGTCKGQVLGAGYAMSCDDDMVPFNITPITVKGVETPTATVFFTDFMFDEYDGGNFTFTTYFLNRTFPGLTGFVNRTVCLLQPATVHYPIRFTNDTVSLDPSGSWQTDRVERLRPETVTQRFGGRSTHGGLALYFKSAFASGAEVWYDPIRSMQINMNGSTIFGYVQGTDGFGLRTTSVQTSFQSPTFDILSAVREVAFRTTIRMPASNATIYFNATGEVNQTELDAWEAATAQPILVEQASVEVVYKSQYVFLIIAVVLTICATFAVLVVFNGWWLLGRHVSLSPIEIAKAFAAPSLADSNSNAEMKMLLRQIGSKEVRLGTTADGSSEHDVRATTLRFDSAGKCERPRHGQTFGQ